MGVCRTIVEKLCIAITIVLVYENALVFYQFLFPRWWSLGDYSRFFFHIIIGHWLLINTVVHYHRAVTTSPGFVADLQKETTSKKDSNHRTCSKCNLIKAERAHHCKICRKCVLRYDHHCPWINNCVGYRNHVHFFLFCVYMTLIAGYATISARNQFQLVAFNDQILFGLIDPIWQPYNLTMSLVQHQRVGPLTGVLIMFLFSFNLCAMGLVLSLTIWQTMLISKGQTCVEEKIFNSKINHSDGKANEQKKWPYDMGWKMNWMNFFEVETYPQLIVRILIPFSFQPRHDGTQWPSKIL